MRHRVKSVRLGRNSAARTALLRGLATALIMHDRIETTEVKAKQLRSYVEKLITLGKRDTVQARRLVAAKVYGKEAVKRLFADVAPRFSATNGGYTTIYKSSLRRGDATQMAIIEFNGYVLPEVKEETSKTKKS